MEPGAQGFDGAGDTGDIAGKSLEHKIRPDVNREIPTPTAYRLFRQAERDGGSICQMT